MSHHWARGGAGALHVTWVGSAGAVAERLAPATVVPSPWMIEVIPLPPTITRSPTWSIP